MKAKFLKRSESEKSDKVKVIFEVEGGSSVFQLEKGMDYDIKPHELLLPGAKKSAKEKLQEIYRLAGEVYNEIPDEKEPGLPLAPLPKTHEKCKNCVSWAKEGGNLSLPMGECKNVDSSHHRESTPLYHWCSYWRSNAEEDKDTQGSERDAEAEIRGAVDAEEPDNNGSSGGKGRPEAKV